jgi:hypothetical protein
MNYHEFEPPRVSEIAMRLVRNTLWRHVPKKSVVSGLWLRSFENTPLFANCFLHVLPIKEFPMFKYYMKNIILCTPGEKSLYEQCTEESLIQYSLTLEQESKGKARADWGFLKTLEGVLRAEYKHSFPITRHGIVGYNYSLDEQQQIIGRLNQKFILSLR